MSRLHRSSRPWYARLRWTGWRLITLILVSVLVIKGCANESLPSDPATSESGAIASSAATTSSTITSSTEFVNSPGDLPDFMPPDDTFEDRARQLIEYHATHPPNRDRASDPSGYVKSGVYTAMALYASGDIDGGNRMADDLFSNPHSASMFLVMAGMDLYMRYKDVMPEEIHAKARRFITSFDDYTGGTTENHGIMFATGGYLAAQEWPDWERADQVRDQTRSHLYEFVENVSLHGVVEHDSPIYHVFFINSFLSLHDHATDPEMQQRAKVGLELLLTTMAPEWLHGYWPTATLRTVSFTHDPKRVISLTGPVGWLYWGGSDMPVPEDGCAIMSAVSDYRIPEVLHYIGQDRRRPYVHRETHGQRFNRDDKYRKSTYMDRQYALYNQFDGYGDLAWHDQLQRMGVVWVSDAPGATFVVKNPVEGVRGDTDHGQVLLHQRAMIGVYESTMTGFLPATEAVVEKVEDDGWLFIHGGPMLLAFKSAQGYDWQETIDLYGTPFDSFYSDADRNGFVIQTAPVEDFAGGSPRQELDAFAEAVKTRTVIDDSRVDQSRPALTFTTLSGDVMALEFNRDRSINGEVVDYSTWPLFENPWMTSEAGEWLEMRYGDLVRTYNFQDWTITDTTTDTTTDAAAS
ncbi:MAG: hypothetical protein IGR80_10615 [Synechococcales cyanobacterium K44_A2020_017]|nr:hypothetical protein [Synechococcales cyanobacterium K32_A2020_035]MBF2095195.1 hypothetical protein [Synechococcales cyanobacterium K44_A2020_017]